MSRRPLIAGLFMYDGAFLTSIKDSIMFGRDKTKSFSGKREISSRLDAQLQITGDISFDHGTQLDGRVHGNIFGNGPDSVLVVGPLAMVKGSIDAAHVIVKGTVEGRIKAGTLVVSATGKIVGDVHYSSIQMEDGAQVRGALFHADPSAVGQKLLKPEKEAPIDASKTPILADGRLEPLARGPSTAGAPADADAKNPGLQRGGKS